MYDSNGIMTDILHKSGNIVKQRFSYLYDDVYNIEQVTHEDGSYWTYGYDNRYRLTSAVRHNANDTIQASYAYDYDTGDNMTSKTEPWGEDFADGSLSGDWNGSSATDWPVTSGEARNVVGGSNRLMWKTNTDASNELRFRYVNYDTGSAAKNLFASGRYTSAGDRVGVLLRPDCMLLQQYVASTNTWTTLDADLTATSTQGQHYDVRMEMNGANVKVWRDGALVLESTAATVTTTDTVRLQASANASFGVDNVMFLAGSLARTTTMTHRANNELDQVTDYNGTASYTFDAWGRTNTEAKNGVTRTYSWTSANLLAGIDSSSTSETDVGYFYTGDLKRIWRMENATLNNIYTWDAGFNEITESAVGNPLKTYVPGLAEVIGNDLSTSADYRYLTTDHIGSTRGMWNGSIAQTGSWEFTPYGSPFNFAGPSDVTRLFTGHDLDNVTGQYYAFFRSYVPSSGRWLRRDPLGMVSGTNMYAYVDGNPVGFIDPLGLTKLSFDIDSGTLTVDPEVDGREPYTIPATSGSGWNMNNPAATGKKNAGPIPPGDYNIDNKDISDPNALWDYFRNRQNGDWGDWRVPIVPLEGTDTQGRSGFFLHGGKKPGSAGCIDVGGGIFGDKITDQLKDDLMNDKDGDIPVTVTN